VATYHDIEDVCHSWSIQWDVSIVCWMKVASNNYSDNFTYARCFEAEICASENVGSW